MFVVDRYLNCQELLNNCVRPPFAEMMRVRNGCKTGVLLSMLGSGKEIKLASGNGQKILADNR